MTSRLLPLLLAAALVAAASAAPAATKATIGINVVLNRPLTAALQKDISRFGQVGQVIQAINAFTLKTTADQLPAVRALPYVAFAAPDSARNGSPVDTVALTDFSGGLSTWDQDAIDVTDFGVGRSILQDGSGVYVAVVDTGLVDSWRQYFPQERVATQFAKAFRGGGGDNGNVSDPTNMWEHDQNSHGTHVTSTILGYSLFGTPVNGTAPKATVIPVKVLGQNGSGWSSVVAQGIVHVAQLKQSGALGGAPVVINMSLGGPSLDGMEKAAIDFAIAQGVHIVAAAGNEGTDGMGYPGAYAPVISVAAAGWVQQWPTGNRSWWWNRDVPEAADAGQFYIADFSSRAKPGQDLDVAAPGVWAVGPYQVNSGQLSYYFLSGTSMASPHVAGIVALMLQKNPSLSQAAVESLLTSAAFPMGAGCATVNDPSAGPIQQCWDTDATGAGFITAAAALNITP